MSAEKKKWELIEKRYPGKYTNEMRKYGFMISGTYRKIIRSHEKEFAKEFRTIEREAAGPIAPAPIPTPMDIGSMARDVGQLLGGASRRRRRGRSSTILAGRLTSQMGKKLLG